MKVAVATARRAVGSPQIGVWRDALRVAITLAAVTAAAIVGWQLWIYYLQAPWTRDARVRADVVQVAADVSGLVSAVVVHDNEQVERGQLLFSIDPVRFQLALKNAEANVVHTLAAAQEADREMERFQALNHLSVSTEQQQQRAAAAAEAGAVYTQALVARDTAALNLARAEVRAPVNGIITNFSLRPGNYVNGGQPLFALVDSDSFYVDGYFEETKLPRIAVGDTARIHFMGEQTVLTGHVQSIARGIADREIQGNSDLLANVNPTFSWVRLAQRIPVRIELDTIPAGLLVAGRTATVQIRPNERASER